MDSMKKAADYVSETVQGKSSTASKETNKQVAKDDNAGLGTRAQSAKDAMGDKMDEASHDAKAEANKPFNKNQ